MSEVLRNGADAFALLEENRGLLVKLCSKYFTKIEDREDLQSLVVLKIASDWQKFDCKKGKFGTFLGMVVRSQASAMRRRMARDPQVAEEIDGSYTDFDRSGIIELTCQVDSLPFNLKRFFVESVLNGEGTKSTARKFGVTEGTARTYVWRARKLLGAMD